MRNIIPKKKKKDSGKTMVIIGLAIFNLGLIIYLIWDKFGKDEYLELEPPHFGTKEKKPSQDEPVKEEPVAAKKPEKVVEEVEEVETETIGSTESDKYHRPTCRYAKDMAKENIINFESVEDAVGRGYKPCGVCH